MKSETKLVCNPCVIYLANEKLHSYDHFMRWKNNAWAVWGPSESWGPWARAQRAHWIRRPCVRRPRVTVHR